MLIKLKSKINFKGLESVTLFSSQWSNKVLRWWLSLHPLPVPWSRQSCGSQPKACGERGSPLLPLWNVNRDTKGSLQPARRNKRLDSLLGTSHRNVTCHRNIYEQNRSLKSQNHQCPILKLNQHENQTKMQCTYADKCTHQHRKGFVLSYSICWFCNSI